MRFHFFPLSLRAIAPRFFRKIPLAFMIFAAAHLAQQANCAHVDPAQLNLGRRVVVVDPAAWERWGQGLQNPSSGATVAAKERAALFAVPEPDSQMVWQQSLRPVWLDFHHSMTLTYRSHVPSAGDIIIDNAAAAFSGNWSTGTSAPNKYGADYRYAASGSGAAATYNANVPTAGTYAVYVWYPHGANRADNAPCTVIFSGGSHTYAVNQQENGGQWVRLGAHSFEAGGGQIVIGTAGANPSVVMADAVRFILQNKAASSHSSSAFSARKAAAQSVDFPLVRLKAGTDSWFTALNYSGIEADGQTHTKTIDLRLLTQSAQICGIQIRLDSDSTTGTTFLLENCEFTDQPPGHRYPPVVERPPAQAGFVLDASSTAGWMARTDWIGVNPPQEYSVRAAGGSLIFAVADASKAMKWSKTLSVAQDVSAYPYVVMRYRCGNLRASASDYALYLSGTDSAGTAAEARPFYQASLIADGTWRWAVAQAPGISKVKLVAVQTAANAAGNAYLEISTLQFMDSDPRTNLSYFTSLDAGWDGLTSGTAGFEFLDLTTLFNADADQLLPRMSLNLPWFGSEQLTAAGRVPFRIRLENPNLVATELPTLSNLIVPVRQPACEVYLLLGTYFPAAEDSSSNQILAAVDETERFSVNVAYADGTREDYLPADISSGLHRIENMTFSALAFPADPGRAIETITLRDRSDGGLFALAAVSLNTSGKRMYEKAFAIPPPDVVASIPDPPGRAARIEFSTPTLILENAYSIMRMNCSAGLALREWTSHFTGHSLLGSEADGRIFSGKIGAAAFTSRDFEVKSVDVRTSGTDIIASIGLSLRGFNATLDGTLLAWTKSQKAKNQQNIEAAQDANDFHFSLELKNEGAQSLPLEITFPDLPQLTLGPDPANLHYAFPRQTFLLGSAAVAVEESYSGDFPVQFMDVYDPSQGWGLCLLVKDLNLISKYFRLAKNADSASLSVRYPTLASRGLPAGATMELAPFALHPHVGDWHEGLAAYRRWSQIWYAPRSPRQKWFQEIYTCRRDYPTGGSGYLFDRTANTYTFDLEIQNAARNFGAPPDLIDISSWGWSPTTGRVGDYRRYDLGGLDNFRSGIAYSQQRDIPVGLYIEGYGLDDRSTIWSQGGSDWVIIKSTGAPYGTDPHVWMMCSHVAAWQNYMRELYNGVAAETGADAMYIDVYGMAWDSFACHSGTHGHAIGEKPLRGEMQMTRAIREGLNAVRPGIPIYTEYTPVDVTSQYQDGSFSYTIWYGDNQVCPTETNLYRFCFPDFKQIEIVNGLFDAKNWTEEGLKKAFMNGEGLWIKGELGSWYDANTLAFYNKSHEIFRDHRDAFTCADPEPFLPVSVGNVFAHRFAAGEKQIINLYNANWSGVSGELLRIGAVSDAHVVDLWGERMLEIVPAAPAAAGALAAPAAAANPASATHAVQDYAIRARLFPRDIGCVGIFKRRMDVRRDGDMLTISLLGAAAIPDASASIELVGVNGQQRRVQTIPITKAEVSASISAYFTPLPDTLLIKYKQNGIVLDEYILASLAAPQPPPSVLWALY